MILSALCDFNLGNTERQRLHFKMYKPYQFKRTAVCLMICIFFIYFFTLDLWSKSIFNYINFMCVEMMHHLQTPSFNSRQCVINNNDTEEMELVL